MSFLLLEFMRLTRSQIADRAQPVPARVEAQPDEPVRPLIEGFVEPCEGVIVLTETGIDERDAIGRHKFATRKRLQLSERLPGFGGMTGGSLDKSPRCDRNGPLG